jgi:hypothetical protein
MYGNHYDPQVANAVCARRLWTAFGMKDVYQRVDVVGD